MVLTNCKKTYNYKIENLPDLHLLRVLGLRKGTDFMVQSKQPLGGPIVVKVGNRSIAIAKDVAREIVVQEVS